LFSKYDERAADGNKKTADISIGRFDDAVLLPLMDLNGAKRTGNLFWR
jgi:hypothetical protein